MVVLPHSETLRERVRNGFFFTSASESERKKGEGGGAGAGGAGVWAVTLHHVRQQISTGGGDSPH
jgi:hypothetical protein